MLGVAAGILLPSSIQAKIIDIAHVHQVNEGPSSIYQSPDVGNYTRYSLIVLLDITNGVTNNNSPRDLHY